MFSFEESVQFSNGGFVIFHMESDKALVKVSGCVTFGGSITVAFNVLHSPNNISTISLMTFNCSTGRFDHVGIDTVQSCSTGLDYLAHALVINLRNNDDCQKEDSIPFLWVLWIFIGLVVLAVAVMVVGFIVKTKNTKKSEDKLFNDDMTNSML